MLGSMDQDPTMPGSSCVWCVCILFSFKRCFVAFIVEIINFLVYVYSRDLICGSYCEWEWVLICLPAISVLVYKRANYF